MTTLLSTRRRDDTGIALITVVIMLALVSALTLTLAVVTINNLTSARLSQQAGAALNASDAGVAQAVTYLRENGTGTINKCSPTCTGEPWGNKDNPATVTVPGKAGQSFKVWIEPLVRYPANKTGFYRIHSTGTAGGPAGRTIEVDAEVTGLKIPLGVMAESVNGGGNSAVHRQSIFSTGCVYRRDKIEFDGIDLAYGIPAAVHTSQIISNDVGSGKYCPGMKKPIHATTGTPADRYCNIQFPYDQDRNGGPLNGTSCYNRYNGVYPGTSRIVDDADLFEKFDLSPKVFTQAQLDQLKTVAVSQGSYYTSASGWSAPTRANAIIYFDLTKTDPGGMVDLNYLTPAWSRPPELDADDPECLSRSLVVIIEGGNARMNSNSQLAASTFLLSKDPYGNITKANGTADYTGTLYANNLDLTGTADLHMDPCFLANPSPLLTTVRTLNYREVDR